MTKEDRKEGKARQVIRINILLLTIMMSIIILSVILVFPVYKVTGSSMFPTFYEGDLLITYKGKEYTVGDVIIFERDGKTLIRRIIAKGGDTVSLDAYTGIVHVNGNPLDETYIIINKAGSTSVFFPTTVPEGEVFVMGDYRDQAIDSRMEEFGCVPEYNIKGSILMKFYPLHDITWYGFKSTPLLEVGRYEKANE